MVCESDATRQPTPHDIQLMSKHRVRSTATSTRMARPGRPERNRAARSFGQLRRFDHVINSNKVSVHTGVGPPFNLRFLAMQKFYRDRKRWRSMRSRYASFAWISCGSSMSAVGPGCVKTLILRLSGATDQFCEAAVMLGLRLSIRRRPECALPVSCCRPERAGPFRSRRA
jgi:hypothetical protein